MIRPTTKLVLALTLSSVTAYLWWSKTEQPIVPPYTPPTLAEQNILSPTLDGKVVVTYYGNYNTPNDGAGRGFGGWTLNRRGGLTVENAAVSLFPDLKELSPKERRPAKIKKPDGKQVEIFSSHDKRTIEKHLKGVRENDIDVVLLKRFAADLDDPLALSHHDKVLANIRAAAASQRRSYFLIYELQDLPETQIYKIRDDWANLSENLKITEDDTYQRHRSKPLIAISASGFEGRPEALGSLLELAAFFKSKGCSLLLQVPPGWRTGEQSQEWKRIALHTDLISLLPVGQFSTPAEAASFGPATWTEERLWCEERNIDYLPLIVPGFHVPSAQQPSQQPILRSHGKLFWAQFEGVKRSDSKMLCIESFDGMHNGTAILDWDKNASLISSFDSIAYENLPNDHYLKLARDGIRTFRVHLVKFELLSGKTP